MNRLGSSRARAATIAVAAIASMMILFSSTLVTAGASRDGAGIAAVRAATSRYHDVNQALADGYVPVSPCIEAPGLGVMGIHYLNPALASDLTIDARAPEILLYVPSDSGLRLVGVEYWSIALATPRMAQLPGSARLPPRAASSTRLRWSSACSSRARWRATIRACPGITTVTCGSGRQIRPASSSSSTRRSAADGQLSSAAEAGRGFGAGRTATDGASGGRLNRVTVRETRPPDTGRGGRRPRRRGTWPRR